MRSIEQSRRRAALLADTATPAVAGWPGTRPPALPPLNASRFSCGIDTVQYGHIPVMTGATLSGPSRRFELRVLVELT